MLIFVGLGNPDPEHQMNRHNIGFMALDTIHRRHKFPPWVKNFDSLCSGAQLDGEKVLMVKPQTYMNLSGQAVQKAASYYKVPLENVFVFHDELDLAPGKFRVKKGGGSAGHNGLRSIDELLGPDYWRVRMGIGRPAMKEQVSGHVLGNFWEAEADWLVPLLAGTGEFEPLLVKGDTEHYMSKVAQLIPAPKPDAKPH